MPELNQESSGFTHKQQIAKLSLAVHSTADMDHLSADV